MEIGRYVLCVDNDADNCELIRYIFEEDGHEVLICATADACLEYAQKFSLSAIVLDYWLSGIEGAEICREIRKFRPATPIIFFTGDARDANRKKGISAGADAYLVKPNDLENVLPTVNRLIKESLLPVDKNSLFPAHKPTIF